MRVFLDQTVRPDRDEQESLEALKETPIVPAENYGELWQTFTLPDDVLFDLDSSVIPKHCLCRFKGEIQLANDGYRNAYFSSSQLVIFDQELLKQLYLLMLYTKGLVIYLDIHLKRDYNQNGTHHSGMWGC